MLLGLGACSAPALPTRAGATKPTGERGQERAPARAEGARYFQVIPEEAYWVTHDDALDRVVVGGARLELASSGEVLRAAWESAADGRGDPLQGSLAVAPHLGGGFVHWTGERAFRSSAFTGPLEPVSLGIPPGGPEAAIRGARNGLKSVLLFTDGGPREILPGAARATRSPEPALADLAAAGPSRALKLDLFGRTAVTVDGGRTFRDAWPSAGVGIAPRAIAAGPNELWIETWQGRAELGPDGTLAELVTSTRSGLDYGRPFQLVFQGNRAAERETLPWGFRDLSPLYAAVFGGATLPDGTAIGVSHGSLARVDLATGEPRSMASDALPQGLECLPLPARDGVLFVCSWESYQGHGGYVLRSAAGEPPVVERAFSEDGYFVADDHGALGFVGPCEATARLVDEEGRVNDASDILPKPVICVRRGPGDWVERAVDLEPGMALLGWAPRGDGTAVALVIGLDVDALPGALTGEGARRVRDRGGVRVVRLYQELGTFRWSRPSFRPYMYGRSSPSVFIDKRFRARDDGHIEAWVGQSDAYDAAARVSAGVTLAPDGRPTVHGLPPSPSFIVATGDYGVTVTRDGRLYETTDHGRTWRDAGPSPIPPLTGPGTCSRLGCVLPSLVRVGWGPSRVDVRVGEEAPKPPDDPTTAAPELACSPVGAPLAIEGAARAQAKAPKPAGDRSGTLTVATGYGDTIEIIRETADDPGAAQGAPAAPSPAPGPLVFPSVLPAPPLAPPSAPAPSTKPARPSPSVSGVTATLRTHSLFFRPPFEPDAPVRRLNATNAAFGYRRPPAVPLLGERGDVSLLLFPDGGELLVTPDDVITLPSFDPRRYGYSEGAGMTGLWEGRDRALVLGDMRRRTGLEEHGPLPHRPPLYVALDREQIRRRTIALGRKDDGAVGILVLDGPAPETAGVAELDRAATSLKPVQRLAPWSSLTPASDARCSAEKGAFRALVALDPSRWLALDARSLPGVALGSQGMALVRWGRDRVCLEALDLTARDARRRGDSGTSSLVIRFDAKSNVGRAALRWEQLRQPLRCSLAPRAGGEAR